MSAGVVEAGHPVAAGSAAADGEGAGAVPTPEVVAEQAGTTASVPEAERAPLAEGDPHGGPADEAALAAQTVAAAGVEAGPDAARLPEAVPVPPTEPAEDAQPTAPESEQVSGVGGPEADDVSDAVEAIRAPEVMAPDAGQAADSADLAPAQPTDTAVPTQGPDTAVTPEAPESTPFPAAPHTSHPADGSPAPAEDAASTDVSAQPQHAGRQPAPGVEPITPADLQVAVAASPIPDPAAALQDPVLNAPEHHDSISVDPANAPHPAALTGTPDTAVTAAEEQPGPTAEPLAAAPAEQLTADAAP
ncbi:hypothetical protein GRC12_44250, partial [Streptomyces griseorubiginosus]|nr:hypothetical protein [Streptomyces griseorubiginosus]